MAFSFTHDEIGQAVRGAAQAGLTVQGVFDASGAQSEFSEWAVMRSMGMDIRLDGNPSLMHHKVFIIDEQTVVMGSLNFSNVANSDNDENVLIIDDARLAQAYLAEFRTVYKQAQAAQR
jgi:phosphatidylserine/phosphatidylglycerophosphate/cardiolipin synthase-like enzyme